MKVDTLKAPKGAYRFVILIPHRDALRLIAEYRKMLFSDGFYGAYSFPLAAPLALVSRSFDRAELKELGRNIRNLTKEKDGKIVGSSAVQANCPGGFSFFGPGLNLQLKEDLFPASTKDKILHILSPPVLCVTLLGSEKMPVSKEEPALSFRAASLANLTLRPLDNGAAGYSYEYYSYECYSYEWKIGPPVWLPGK